MKTIAVYPNPASSYVTISCDKMQNGNFVLYNAVGELILNVSLKKENIHEKVNIRNIANGLYNYKIIFDNDRYTGKLNILQ